jgi:ketosteroid isomerase-like protein
VSGVPAAERWHYADRRSEGGAVTSTDSLREVIDRYLDAYNAFHVAGMLGVLHPDVECSNVDAGQVTAAAHGREEFRALAERAVTLFRSRRLTMREYASASERASITVDYEGVLAADLGPEMRAGDTLRLTGRSTFTFRDGLVVELVDES